MASQENDGQEKTHQASDQKLRKAREKGDISVSQELNTFMMYLGVFLAFSLFGAGMSRGVGELLAGMMMHPETVANRLVGGGSTHFMLSFFWELGRLILPVFILPALFVILSLIAQRAVIFAPDKIKPKLSNLSPLSNAKKKYGPSGLGQFVKSLAKLILISVSAGLFLKTELILLPANSERAAQFLPRLLSDKGLHLFVYILISAALIAAIDFPAKWYFHNKKMRMTHQEAKDEHKESDGDPHQKQKRRERALEIANTSMYRDVKDASVVIVNPEHYAVALKWDRNSPDAPQCVAKGVDAIAFRIRELAKLANIPIYENPPTARALYAQVKIGAIISPQHYAAVAAAIHYADQIAKRGF